MLPALPRNPLGKVIKSEVRAVLPVTRGIPAPPAPLGPPAEIKCRGHEQSNLAEGCHFHTGTDEPEALCRVLREALAGR